MRLPHLCGGIVAHPDRPNPSRLDRVGHQRHELIDVRPSRRVMLVEIDARPPEPLETCLERRRKLLRPHPPKTHRKLRGDDRVTALGEFPQPDLRRALAVCGRGVEQIDVTHEAGFERLGFLGRAVCAAIGNLGGVVARHPLGIAPGHGADAQPGDVHRRGSKHWHDPTSLATLAPLPSARQNTKPRRMTPGISVRFLPCARHGRRTGKAGGGAATSTGAHGRPLHQLSSQRKLGPKSPLAQTVRLGPSLSWP